MLMIGYFFQKFQNLEEFWKIHFSNLLHFLPGSIFLHASRAWIHVRGVRMFVYHVLPVLNQETFQFVGIHDATALTLLRYGWPSTAELHATSIRSTEMNRPLIFSVPFLSFFQRFWSQWRGGWKWEDNTTSIMIWLLSTNLVSARNESLSYVCVCVSGCVCVWLWVWVCEWVYDVSTGIFLFVQLVKRTRDAISFFPPKSCNISSNTARKIEKGVERGVVRYLPILCRDSDRVIGRV